MNFYLLSTRGRLLLQRLGLNENLQSSEELSNEALWQDKGSVFHPGGI